MDDIIGIILVTLIVIWAIRSL